MEKKLIINARKALTSRGQVFYKYSTNINGTWYKIAFNKSAGARPEQSGVYEFTVDTQNLSIATGKTYIAKDGIEKRENDTIWIASYSSARKFTDEELRQRDQSKINAIFGNDSLPF